MADASTVRLYNGATWTRQDFVNYYLQPGLKPAVEVDRYWYMTDGPGALYQPGMFPVFVADADEALGQPIVSNGLPLSKLHHAAFDAKSHRHRS